MGPIIRLTTSMKKNIRHIYRYFFMKNYKLRSMVAHHESGHAVLGHIFGHLVAEININFDLDKGVPAYCLKQYRSDTLINNAFENNQPSDLNAIPQATVELAAKRYCCSLLAGPIAEEFHQRGINSIEPIHIQNTHDFRLCFQTVNILNGLYGNNYSTFIADNSNLASFLLKEEQIWSTVAMLSEELLNSKKLKIDQTKIYEIFKIGGIDNYKANVGR